MNEIRLIRVNGELVPDGVNARIKRLLAEEKMRRVEAAYGRVSNRKTLALLSRVWWKAWFQVHGKDSSTGVGRAA